jgi:hypothetical protein
VVHVPIDDGDALRAMLLLGMASSNGGIIEEAKAHRRVLFGMVSRRPCSDEDIGRPALEHIVNGRVCRTNRRQRGLPAFRARRRVGIDAGNTRFWDGGPHPVHKIGWMRVENCRFVALGRLYAVERGKGLVVQRTLDGAQPVGALRMTGRRYMLEIDRMGIKARDHAPI